MRYQAPKSTGQPASLRCVQQAFLLTINIGDSAGRGLGPLIRKRLTGEREND